LCGRFCALKRFDEAYLTWFWRIPSYQ